MSIIKKYKTKMHKSSRSKIAIHDNKGNTYKLTQNGNLESIDLTQEDHLLNHVKVYDPISRQWISSNETTIEKSVLRVIPIKSIRDLEIRTIDRPQYEYSKSQKLSYCDYRNGEMVFAVHGVFDVTYQPIQRRAHKKRKVALTPSCVSKMDDRKYQDFLESRSSIDHRKPHIDLISRKPVEKPIDCITIRKIGETIHYAPLAKPRTAIEDWKSYMSSKVNTSSFSSGVSNSMVVHDLNNNRPEIKPFMIYVRRLAWLGY